MYGVRVGHVNRGTCTTQLPAVGGVAITRAMDHGNTVMNVQYIYGKSKIDSIEIIILLHRQKLLVCVQVVAMSCVESTMNHILW